jgi:hypothetical protein
MHFANCDKVARQSASNFLRASRPFGVLAQCILRIATRSPGAQIVLLAVRGFCG